MPSAFGELPRPEERPVHTYAGRPIKAGRPPAYFVDTYPVSSDKELARALETRRTIATLCCRFMSSCRLLYRTRPGGVDEGCIEDRIVRLVSHVSGCFLGDAPGPEVKRTTERGVAEQARWIHDG